MYMHGCARACTLVLLMSPGLTPRTLAADEPAGFSLGVAAGDVTADAAILWTRADEPGGLVVRVATDLDFSNVVWISMTAALAEHDLTVKVHVSGLSPATLYYYRFERADAPDTGSRVGRFRTAPLPDDPRPVRFAFSGDSNFARSPLGILHHVAAEAPDLFIWFGDTMYGDLASGGLGVATTLDDYRAKYRQMRGDPYVRELLASVAVWVGWDDHEVRNDYAGTDPGLSAAQREAAYQAFFEYMPIRPAGVSGEPYRTYRSVRYGALAELFFLDDRQYRDISAFGQCPGEFDPLGFLLGPVTDDARCAELLAAPRTMLGSQQRDWLFMGLAESTAARKFVVSSVVFSHLGVYPYDRWDGYDHERRRIMEYIDAQRIAGVTFLSTDIHASLHNPDMTRFFRNSGYRLANRVRLSEVTVGPIGTDTFLREIIAGGAAVLRQSEHEVEGLVDALTPLLKSKLRACSGIEFLEPDRFAYGLIEVSGETASVTIRGLRPEQAQQADADALPEPELLHNAALDRAPAIVPCALPVFMAALAAVPWYRTAVRARPLPKRPAV